MNKKLNLRVDIGVALLVLSMVGVFCLQGLGASRDTPERTGDVVALVQGSNVVYVGNMVAIDTNGLAVVASDTASEKVVGRCEVTSDNTGDNYSATRRVMVKRGVFQWDNGGAFTAADIGAKAYVDDDTADTVTTAAIATNDCPVGFIVDVDSGGVWVDSRTSPAL